MISITDIYFRVDSSIVAQGFWEINITEKKKLIDTELKKYIVSKLQELECTRAITDELAKDLSTGELMQILADGIPKEQHFDTLSHFTHYILGVASSLQNCSITWWNKDDESYIKTPHVEFNDSRLWEKLESHMDTNYVQTFNFVYDIFNNNFMVKATSQRLGKGLTEHEG